MIRRVVTQDDHVRVYALTARGVVILSVLLGFAVTGIVLAVLALSRATHVETTTCRVQANGLPASHMQAAMWRDIAVLIRPVPKEKFPPKVVAGHYDPRYFALLNLRQVLPAYNAREAEQPHGRNC